MEALATFKKLKKPAILTINVRVFMTLFAMKPQNLICVSKAMDIFMHRQVACIIKKVILCFRLIPDLKSFTKIMKKYETTLNVFPCLLLGLLTALRPSDGCPIGTNGYQSKECANTCFCEDHCSWKNCKLDEPPQNCLMYANLKWDYDQQRNYWKSISEGIIHKKYQTYK